jgi:hypothetical protein
LLSSGVFGFSAANENAPPLDTMVRSNGQRLDAAWVDGEVIMERRQIKIAMDRAEIGEIRSATSYRVQTSASRGRVRYGGQRSNTCSKDRDLGNPRHGLILEV